MKTLLLLKTPRIDRIFTPPDTDEASRRKGNRSMEKAEVEAAARFLDATAREEHVNMC
jgi:hypothetical protein